MVAGITHEVTYVEGGSDSKKRSNSHGTEEHLNSTCGGTAMEIIDTVIIRVGDGTWLWRHGHQRLEICARYYLAELKIQCMDDHPTLDEREVAEGWSKQGMG